MSGRTFHPTTMILGLLFAGLGVAFLLDQADVTSLNISYVLPVLVIGLGLAVLGGAIVTRRSSEN